MNLWKAFALVMIGILAITVGIRFTYLEVHTFPIDEKQKNSAIDAAKNAFREEMGNSNYTILMQNHGTIISTGNGDKKVARVTLMQGNITMTALVDIDTGVVVEKARIESRGWMTEYMNQNPKQLGRLFKW